MNYLLVLVVVLAFFVSLLLFLTFYSKKLNLSKFQITINQNSKKTLNLYQLKPNQFGGIIKVYRNNKRYFNFEGAIYLRISFENSRYKKQMIRVRIVGTEEWQKLSFFNNEASFLSANYESIKGDEPVTLEFEMYREAPFSALSPKVGQMQKS